MTGVGGTSEQGDWGVRGGEDVSKASACDGMGEPEDDGPGGETERGAEMGAGAGEPDVWEAGSREATTAGEGRADGSTAAARRVWRTW